MWHEFCMKNVMSTFLYLHWFPHSTYTCGGYTVQYNVYNSISTLGWSNHFCVTSIRPAIEICLLCHMYGVLFPACSPYGSVKSLGQCAFSLHILTTVLLSSPYAYIDYIHKYIIDSVYWALTGRNSRIDLPGLGSTANQSACFSENQWRLMDGWM